MGIADKGLRDLVSELEQGKTPELDFSSSTGIVSLDAALGGRLPSGAIEIFGEASTGKTSLLYEIITAAQREDMVVALCPSEYLDIPYMKVFGMDLGRLALITSNHGEEVLEAACHFIEMNKDIPCLLAIDSATSLRPKVDEFNNWSLMLDTFLEVALPELGQGSCIVMTNQVRTRRSIRPDRFFVDGQVDSTARRIIDQFSARLELSREDVKDDSYTLMVNVVSSVFSLPSTIIELPFRKGHGVDTMLDLVRVAADAGVIERAGSWYSTSTDIGTISLGQGEALAASLLELNPELAKHVLDQLMK